MNSDINSLNQLVKIVEFRQVIARRRYENQNDVVNQSERHLAEISQSVGRLSQEKMENIAYMRHQENSSDANKMVKALEYQAHLEYDLERECFYLKMAQEDLATQQAELKKILAELLRYSAKIESITGIKQKRKRALESKDEISREDDYPQSLSLTGGYRG